MRLVLTLVLTAAAATTSADEVWLKGGGRLVGDVISKSATTVVLEVGPGTVKLPLSRVDRIVSSTVALTEFRERAASLSSRDVAGWTALAEWAELKDLRTQSREAWRRVLSADPGNAVAHSALGDTLHQGRWLDFASVQRARGMVEHDGAWMSPAERQASIQREAAEAGARQQAAIADSQRQEAEARVREAEARARTAEADAARAEADADAYVDGGIPLGYGVGGYGVGGYGVGGYGVGGYGIGGPVVVGPGFDPHPPGRPRNGHGHGHGGPHVQPTPQPPASDARSTPVVKSNQRGAGGTKR